MVCRIFSWQTCEHLINLEQCLIFIIPVFLMFASTFKRTHWLVPGYCLGQIPRLEMSDMVTTSEPTCWPLQPREDRSYPGQLFLWEMESHRRRCTTDRFRHQPLATKCCTPRPKWSCTAYFCTCLEFLYQVGTSSANSNPGAGEHTGRFSGNLYPKIRSWQWWRRRQWRWY